MAASPAHASDPFSLVGQTLGGRFQIERFVAEGGFGVVYRAQQVALDRPVAIKILKAAPDLRHETFEAEAKTVARLKHPNIVEVYDFGVTDGPSGLVLHWMALEWLEGRTLAALLAEEQAQSRPPRTSAVALELLRPVLQAVAFAHQQGVAHRDLKPANIFVATQPGVSSLKVLDFGVAQLLAPDRNSARETTQRGPAGFSPDYAAPEQVSYGRTGPWTDVHALGLMFTELMVGAGPYDGSDPEARFAQVIAERRPTPAARGVDAGAWEPVLQKALARRPAERHPDGGALLAALEKGLAAPASQPPPGRAGHRLRKPALLALAVTLTVAAAFLGWRASRPRDPVADAGRIRIAVLPFDNLTSDPAQEYLSDGLTGGMISQLGRLLPQRLTVIARTSVARYKRTRKSAKQIGQELGVSYLLAASVERDASRLRVDAHLTRVSDETEIWSERFDREMADVLGLQTGIAQAVAFAVRLKLGAREMNAITRSRAVNPAAYEAYLHARFFDVEGDSVRDRLRVSGLEQAIKLDPGFAAAHAALANALVDQTSVAAQEKMPRAKSAALEALRLDEELPAAHAALGRILLTYDWNWGAAERHFRKALELDASEPEALLYYSQYCLSVGRFDESIALRTRVLEVDPLSPWGTWALGGGYYFARRFDTSISQLRQVLAADQTVVQARNHLARSYLQKGMLAEAAAEARRVLVDYRRTWNVGDMGFILARAGHANEASAALERLFELRKDIFVPSMELARIYAGLGQYDEAFRWLEKGFHERNFDLIYLRVDPMWDPMRAEPRFADLVRRVGIPEPAKTSP